jgi:hypothetical protein
VGPPHGSDNPNHNESTGFHVRERAASLIGMTAKMESFMNGSMRWLPALATAAVLAACGGGSGSSGGTGTLKVALTDAPACGYDNVWVTVTKVRVHRSETAGDGDVGWSEVVVDPASSGRRIDLLELQNGVLADLGQTALPAGHYSQVRLVLADNNDVAHANELVLSSTKEHVLLDTPSAQQSGLKLKHGFDVEAGTEADLVLDFDACRSIVKAGNSGKYNLKPVITAMPILTGSIVGAVDPQAARANASVALQRFDPSTGVVSVVRATTVRADGTWALSPVPVSPVSGSDYNLVIGSPGYASVVYTSVPVATGASTAIPAVTLTTSAERRISGSISPVVVDGNGAVQALQRIVDETGTTADVVIEAAYANADAMTGAYEVYVPLAAARVAPYGATLAAGDNGGLYTVSATAGAGTKTAEADVNGSDAIVDFFF